MATLGREANEEEGTLTGQKPSLRWTESGYLAPEESRELEASR
jgi:hypothetical protein